MKLTQQHRFHPIRAWRFDFAIVTHKVAIEIQGYGEGHTSYLGMSQDYEKHNEALRLGWIIIYIMSHQLEPHVIQKTNNYITRIIKERAGEDVGTDIQTPSRQWSRQVDKGRGYLRPGANQG